jgi:hypothetical protein
MSTQSLSLALVVVLLCPFASAQSRLPNTDNLAVYTDIPPGPVSGIWTKAGSPYHITGEIAVPNDSTLLIEPGVEVVFMGHYKLNVQGRLLAVGSKEDSIRFRAVDTEAGWHGIRFDGTASTNDTSKIVYSVLRNGKANTGIGFDRCGGAILIRHFDKVLVSNCLLDSNWSRGDELNPPTAGPAIYIYEASPTVTQSSFFHNTGSLGSAIFCGCSPHAIISHNVLSKNWGGRVGSIVTWGDGSPIISGNLVVDNTAGVVGGGICIEDGSPWIENNIVIRNHAQQGGGISFWSGTRAVLLNNTIAYNVASNSGGGVICEANAIFFNNIICKNAATNGNQVYLADKDVDILYCNIQGGKEGFAGPGAGANYTGLYANNVDFDPMFLNAQSDDDRLSDSSLCLGAGADSVEISGVWYHVPPSCFLGNARPSPPGSRPDIGACESPLSYSVTGQAYAHNVLLSRCGRDTLGIAARVENPRAHDVAVVASLTEGSGAIIDSVFLKDDGFHGDGTSADGLWGYQYVPKKDDTINATIRTDDLTLGALLTIPERATYVFTRGPILGFDTRSAYLGQLSHTLQSCDTTFMVRNLGYGGDSVSVTLDYGNVTPDSAVAVTPTQFALAAGDSVGVRYRVRPLLLAPDNYYSTVLWMHSRFGFTQTLFSKPILFETVVTDDVPVSEALPAEFALEQNFPNPFNPSTTIRYELPKATEVRLGIFDMLGREVSVLVNARRDAGVYEVKFDASRLVTGVYLCRLQAGDFVQTRKLLLLE